MKGFKQRTDLGRFLERSPGQLGRGQRTPGRDLMAAWSRGGEEEIREIQRLRFPDDDVGTVEDREQF